MNELLGWYGYGDNDRGTTTVAADETNPKLPPNHRMNVAARTTSLSTDNNNSMASINSCMSDRCNSSSTEEPDFGGTTSPDSLKSATNQQNGKRSQSE